MAEVQAAKNHRLLSKRITQLLILMRPFTLLAPFVGVLSGGIMALAFYGKLDILLPGGTSGKELIYSAATFALANAASNVLNQVYDLDIDRINKPYRPLPSKVITPHEAMTFVWLLYLFILFRGGMVSRTLTYFLLAFILLTIFYSMPPLRFKKRLWVSNLVISIGRGPVLFVGGWSLFGDPLHPAPWFVGLILGVYLFGTTTSKDFTDIKGDAKYGSRTIPVVYGKRRAGLFTAPFFVVPYLLIPVGVYYGFLIPRAMIMMSLIVWGGYVALTMRNFANTRDKKFENTRLWVHMYLMLMALQAGFAFVYVFA